METDKYINIHQPLIDLCCKGDTRAQFELYQLYSKAMYNTCYRIVGHTPRYRTSLSCGNEAKKIAIFAL